MFSFSFFLIYKYCKQGSMECCPVLSKASLTEIITSFLHNSGLFSKWQGFSKKALIYFSFSLQDFTVINLS